jgi:hypothetical protein
VVTLVNILMMNIGYEIPVIPLILHLILISLFILNRDLKRLYNYFVVHRTEPLPVIDVAFTQNRRRWIRYGLKLSLIAFVIFAYLKEQYEVIKYRYGNRANYKVHGIFRVKDFYHNNQLLPPLTTDSVRWDKMAISGSGSATVVHMNESQEYYSIKVDTTKKTLELLDDTTTHGIFRFKPQHRRSLCF